MEMPLAHRAVSALNRRSSRPPLARRALALFLILSACGGLDPDSSGEPGDDPSGHDGGGAGRGGSGSDGSGGLSGADGGIVPDEPLPLWEDLIPVGRLHQIKITIAAADVPKL